MGLKVDFVLEIHPCSFSPLQYNLLRDFWVTVGSKIQIISSCVGSYVHVQPCSEQTSYVLQSYSHYPRPFIILHILSQLTRNIFQLSENEYKSVVCSMNKTVENCNLECFWCSIWNIPEYILWHIYTVMYEITNDHVWSCDTCHICNIPYVTCNTADSNFLSFDVECIAVKNTQRQKP